MIKDKISTTQIAGMITIGLVLYNAFARNTGKPSIDLTQEELATFATLVAPAISALYMMRERTKLSKLKWGIFK